MNWQQTYARNTHVQVKSDETTVCHYVIDFCVVVLFLLFVSLICDVDLTIVLKIFGLWP